MNLVYICNHYGLHQVAQYWEKVVDINNWQQHRISKLIVKKLFGTLTNKKIVVLGFAFKANTNDTRESPAINICKELLEEGGLLSIYDPKVELKKIESELGPPLKDKDQLLSNNGQWIYSKTIKSALLNADAAVIMTEWDEFNNINWEEMACLMRKPTWIFDTRSILDASEVKKYGLNLWVVGDGENDI